MPACVCCVEFACVCVCVCIHVCRCSHPLTHNLCWVSCVSRLAEYKSSRSVAQRRLIAESYLLILQVPQGRHEKFRIKGDGNLLPPVIHGHGFLGFSDVRGVGGNIYTSIAYNQFHGIRLFGGQERYPPSGFQESLPAKFQRFLCLSGNDLPVIGVVALNQFGDNHTGPHLKYNLVI